jgi:flagellar biosynthesis protein
VDEAKKKQRAVALKYDPTKSIAAPKVLAAGKGAIAEKILELAREKGIPLYKDPELVEVLSQLDVGTEIQPELYQAVAEVLIFIFKMNQKKRKAGARKAPVNLGHTVIHGKNH